MKPTKIERPSFDKRKLKRFCFMIDWIPYYTSIMDVYNFVKSIKNVARLALWGIDYDLLTRYLEVETSYHRNLTSEWQEKLDVMLNKVLDKAFQLKSCQKFVPSMSDEELKEAKEHIERERELSSLNYRDFCNEVWLDANEKESEKSYNYMRNIFMR